MKLIDDFIKQYRKQYDYYQKLSLIIKDICEDELSSSGIKAIVSSRAKKEDSLREKIIQRNKDNKYKNIDEIKSDIQDLSGVRIALYFPDERDSVDKIINNNFIINSAKNFPKQSQKPNLLKRFSGYWANHYRIMLKQDSIHSRYIDTVSEIQVASVLMHAWSEIEHDLVYKPKSGDLSDEELSILDEINGLVITGEIALERLRKAGIKRIKKQSKINDNYELKYFLQNYLKTNSNKYWDIGDTKFLNNILNIYKKSNIDDIDKYLKNIDFNNESDNNSNISYMILNNLISDNINYDVSNDITDIYTKHFNRLKLPKKSIFERYIKAWIIFEKSINRLYNQNNAIKDNFAFRNYRLLENNNILESSEVKTLIRCRNVRNEIMHGKEAYDDNIINELLHELQDIIAKIILYIDDKIINENLTKELSDLF
jgi:ppGpp synthetase/RelA/SpoT-type nucleotidyltranferase